MAFIIDLEFQNVINVSTQVGDTVFYAPTTQVGSTSDAYNTATIVDTIALGEITEIINPDLFNGPEATIRVLCDLIDPVTNNPLTQVPSNVVGSFIMFGKNKKVNTNSLLGYYAEVKFVNDSKEKIEMFSVGAEVSESSK